MNAVKRFFAAFSGRFSKPPDERKARREANRQATRAEFRARRATADLNAIKKDLSREKTAQNPSKRTLRRLYKKQRAAEARKESALDSKDAAEGSVSILEETADARAQAASQAAISSIITAHGPSKEDAAAIMKTGRETAAARARSRLVMEEIRDLREGLADNSASDYGSDIDDRVEEDLAIAEAREKLRMEDSLSGIKSNLSPAPRKTPTSGPSLRR